MIRIPKSQYAELYGPTTGDRIRLADTELWIEIERDHTVYGNEVCFGGGKVIRDGMGQSQISNADGAMDTVITNAVIMDAALGIIKADLGIRDGRIGRHRQGGQPRCAARCGRDHRPRHGDYCGRRLPAHRWRHGLAHPFYLPATGGRSPCQRHYHHAWRRHRPCHGHQRHHLHPRPPGIWNACWPPQTRCP